MEKRRQQYTYWLPKLLVEVAHGTSIDITLALPSTSHGHTQFQVSGEGSANPVPAGQELEYLREILMISPEPEGPGGEVTCPDPTAQEQRFKHSALSPRNLFFPCVTKWL